MFTIDDWLVGNLGRHPRSSRLMSAAIPGTLKDIIRSNGQLSVHSGHAWLGNSMFLLQLFVKSQPTNLAGKKE